MRVCQAFLDTWGKGADSFIAMIYESLSIMKDLNCADDGSIFVHAMGGMKLLYPISLRRDFWHEKST